MADKTPEEMEAEIWADVARQRVELREKVREARHRSTKEPFDFERLRQLYEPIAEYPRETLDNSEAERLEEGYYLRLDGPAHRLALGLPRRQAKFSRHAERRRAKNCHN